MVGGKSGGVVVMLSAMSSARAFAAGLALGFGFTIAGTATAYIKGRMDGWARYEDRQTEAALAELTGRMDTFLADLEANTADGDRARAGMQSATQALEEARNALVYTSDLFVCPADPGVGLRIDAAQAAAAAAINRAAGPRGDDRPER
jgi:hypothetical protein